MESENEKFTKDDKKLLNGVSLTFLFLYAWAWAMSPYIKPGAYCRPADFSVNCEDPISEFILTFFGAPLIIALIFLLGLSMRGNIAAMFILLLVLLSMILALRGLVVIARYLFRKVLMRVNNDQN